MSFLDRIAECNRHDPAGFVPFRVAGAVVGRLRPDFATKLAAFPDAFVRDRAGVALAPRLDTPGARTHAVEAAVRALEAAGAISGRRDERLPVVTAWGAPVLFELERAAAVPFGIRAFGVHMTGYVRAPDGLQLWIARRSWTKPVCPGMLDNMVAGGQPAGLSPLDNLVKECAEEAAIPAALARQARPCGEVAYVLESAEGLKSDTLFCYDLELPAAFEPRNTDGELEEFFLWPVARVAAVVRETQAFKFNCNLVLIDFLVRHGLLAPDDPDPGTLAAALRRGW